MGYVGLVLERTADLTATKFRVFCRSRPGDLSQVVMYWTPTALAIIARAWFRLEPQLHLLATSDGSGETKKYRKQLARDLKEIPRVGSWFQSEAERLFAEQMRSWLLNGGPDDCILGFSISVPTYQDGSISVLHPRDPYLWGDTIAKAVASDLVRQAKSSGVTVADVVDKNAVGILDILVGCQRDLIDDLSAQMDTTEFGLDFAAPRRLRQYLNELQANWLEHVGKRLDYHVGVL